MSDSTTIVIFGASGDLTKRKLIPALYNNFKKDRLSMCTNVVGFSRFGYSDEDFRNHLREGTTQFSSKTFDADVWNEFAKRLHYFPGDIKDEGIFLKLDAYLNNLEIDHTNRLYYLATSPDFFGTVANQLSNSGMSRDLDINGPWRRIIIEKPFGNDLSSAQELNHTLHSAFEERQIYRIDHYLGKETSQNILFFRFANTIFEPIWNRRYINNVQITVSESVDVGRRADYYDDTGVARDMFQNHLFQLLSLVAMEPPPSFKADAVRNEKVQVFQSIRPVEILDTIRAQYEGYLQTEGVASDSRTPTYAAIKLFIDNWRWKGVPFYLRSGKSLKKKTSDIIIEFQKPPHLMFNLPDGEDVTPNILSLSIQPDEGIHLRFEAKVPDSDQDMRSVDMDFQYLSSFNDILLPEAYETLILEALEGDASLFTRSDGIEASWQIIDPIIKNWEEQDQPPLFTYPQGSLGPKEADELLARSGHQWWSGRID